MRGPDPGLRTLRLLFTGWMVFWIPVVLWAYGPQNFLWLCNIAKFVALFALWTRERFLLSSQAGTVCLVGVIWTLDLLVGVATGGDGAVITAYVFDPDLPLPARLASLYHLFLPALVVRILLQRGYDRRGPWVQTGIGGAAVVAAWLLAGPEQNINWAYGPLGLEVLPQPYWAMAAVIIYPLVVYVPGHGLVRGALGVLDRESTAGERERSANP